MAKICLSCKNTFQGENWDCPHCGKGPEAINGFFAFAPELAQQNSGFEAGFFANLARLETGHFWFETRNRLLQWMIQSYFTDPQNFLEIGCGTGFVLSALHHSLPGMKLSGTDIFTEGLVFASQRVPEAILFQMDARHIPFHQEFDIIGAFDVLEHIAEDEIVLAEMYKAVKPGGGIVLTVPQHQSLWSTVDDLSYHKRRYSRRELVEKVHRAGFQVVRTTSFVSLLLPLMLLVRTQKKQKTEDLDLSAEFKISPSINSILKMIMNVEQKLITLGASFPAGGSLVLVAKK